MSLIIENLTKVYGSQKAVNNISFEVKKGEVVGFLGPNGAGKSTTMKIATTYLPPDAGRVMVGGHDVLEKPLMVKQITGYLPEHNPLYLDMYVHEYLTFVGRLNGLSSSTARERVGKMVAMCGLEREQNKKIEALSKGYRQRVGIAQALIHDPQVLILDEPTSGLDPNQLVEIRKLIRDISTEKTVIFSTHIMQEVEALCSRVIVINRGEIVADDNLANLLGGQKTSVLVAEFDGEVQAAQLASIPGVANVEQAGRGKYRITSAGGADIRPAVFRFAADHQLSLLGLRQEENNLEEVFRGLTSKSTATAAGEDAQTVA